MKKIFTLVSIATIAFMCSCGPSAKQIEEKRIADSIHSADSIAILQANQQMVTDSLAKVQAAKVADSLAKVTKPAKKVKSTKK